MTSPSTTKSSERRAGGPPFFSYFRAHENVGAHSRAVFARVG
jgi:hypothetical protein